MARILIIDDRAVNRQFLATLLGYAGHELLEAANGAEALDQMTRFRPDLVITDILMPRLDGYQFVQRLRADPAVAATPVIFHTATYSQPEAKRLATTVGVDRVLPKPCEPQDILAAVHDALKMPMPAPGAVKGSQISVVQSGGIHDIDDSVGLRVASLRAAHARPDARADASQQFLENLAGLQRVASQLSAAIELGMQAAEVRDPHTLAKLFLSGANKVVRAEIVAIGICVSDPQELHVYARGADSGLFLESGRAGRGLLASQFFSPRTLRENSLPIGGLPAGLPQLRNALVLPVMQHEEVLGWMLFGNRLDAEGFGPDDERIAAVLATELARNHERAAMYDTMQRHAAELQIEVAERKLVEARTRRLNRVYAVLSGINSALVRIRERKELYREACRIAVEEGGLLFAHLSMVDPVEEQLSLQAHHGHSNGLVEVIRRRLALGNEANEQGILALALRERDIVLVNDVENDPRVRIRELLLRHGTRSLAALPLMAGGGVAGVWVLHAAEKNFFDADELRLLRSLAGDLGFALDHITQGERLDRLAYYDLVTGLANRKLFVERLDQYIQGAGPAGGKLALVLADMERLRTVNESLGRQAGDVLLRQLAERLSLGALPAELARAGANEFAIVLRNVKGRTEVMRRVERLWSNWLGQSYRVHDSELKAAARAGIVLYPSDGTNAEALLGSAESALREAKQSGERWVFYARAMTEGAAEKLSLENRLRRALENEEFVLHYQVKVEAQSGAIAGLEALIRWRNPELGLVPPGQFVPLMEESGLILEAGRWAMERAAKDHANWLSQGIAVPRVAVNVSAIQLRRRDFVDTVAQALKYGAPEPGLDLEITESLVMENIEDSIRKLHAVKALGVQVAIDDFGTGYSSLAYLAKLPAQSLKIDRSFVIDMQSPDTMLLVQTIISLAHTLKLKVVAEGVESEDQAKMLTLLRCDELQGYLFSKPEPFAETSARLLGRSSTRP